MKLSGFIFISLLLIFSVTCSDDEFTFQNNDEDPEYSLFTLLDDYPALKDLFKNVDQNEFNHRLADFSDDNIDILPGILAKTDRLIGSEPGNAERPLTDIIAIMRTVLERVMHQDNYDLEPVRSYPGMPSNYTNSFYSFMDKVSDSDLEVAESVLAIANKLLAYISARYSGNIEVKIQEFLADLRDHSEDSMISDIEGIIEDAGKLLIQSNDNLYLDSTGAIRCTREAIDPDNDTDTGTGNMVRGIDTLLSGISDLSSDESIRENFYDIIRGAVIIPSLTVDGKKFQTIIKDFIFNTETWFTESTGTETPNKFNTMSDYKRDTANSYVNAELGNSLKEMFPALLGLLLRSDRNEAMKDDGTGVYPLELLAKGLNSANIDFSSLSIEESLYKMIRYDSSLKDRLTDSSASSVSILDHLMFLFAAVRDIGFRDRITTDPDDPEGLYNHGHGHGQATGGILTVNDALFNMSTGSLLGMDAYMLAMNRDASGQPAGKYTHRSRDSFDKATFTFTTAKPFGNNPFFMDTNFPALQLMPSNLIGDAGSPDGGKQVYPASSDPADPDDNWDTYISYAEDGKNDANTARWMMGMLARTCWRGEGPYYSTEGAIDIGGGNYRYYTPGGEVYAEVNKSGSDWVYTSTKYKSAWNTDYYLTEMGLLNITHTLEHGNPSIPEEIVTGSLQIIVDTDSDGIGAADSNGDTSDDIVAGTDDGAGIISGPGIAADSGTIDYDSREIIFNLAGDPAGDAVYAVYNYTLPPATTEIADQDQLTPIEVSGKKHYAPGTALYYTETWEKVMADTDNAGCITVYENPAIKDSLRECATHEEAIYKNLVWLLNEKKMLLVIPMRVDIGGLGAAVFVIGEFNGLFGVAGGSKVLSSDPESTALADGNGKWAKNGGYSSSYECGDGRLTILCDDNGSMLLPYLYNKLFGDGALMPGILGGNMGPVEKLAFFRNDCREIQSLNAGPGSVYWEDRNALVPLLMAALGEVHKYAEADKNPLKILVDGLIPVLTKPMTYYQKNNSIEDPADPAYIPYPRNCWKPRLADDTHDYLKPTLHLNPAEGETIANYYLPKANPTLLTLLSESDYKKCDGLLALMCRTDLLTRLLQFVQKLGGSAYDDKTGTWNFSDSIDSNFLSWGARRKIFYGIEQLASMIRTQEGEALERGYLSYVYPSWAVYENETEIRSEDYTLESIIENLITDGIATLPEDYPAAADWADFNEAIAVFIELFSDNGQSGGRFNMTENLIGLTDVVLSGVTLDFGEISALRHTLASVLTAYNTETGKWEYPGELITILSDELPWIIELYSGTYGDILALTIDVLAEGGFLEYLLQIMSSDYPSSQIFEELFEFLGIDIIARYDSSLWNDLAGLLVTASEMLEQDSSTADDFYYRVNGFENGPDAFTALGELLSK